MVLRSHNTPNKITFDMFFFLQIKFRFFSWIIRIYLLPVSLFSNRNNCFYIKRRRILKRSWKTIWKRSLRNIIFTYRLSPGLFKFIISLMSSSHLPYYFFCILFLIFKWIRIKLKYFWFIEKIIFLIILTSIHHFFISEYICYQMFS